MKLAIYVTGHGFGHLTRTLEVAREVLKLAPETELHIRAPYPEEQIRANLGRAPESFEPVRLDLGLVQVDSLTQDYDSSLERLAWFYGPEGDKLVEAEAAWLERTGIDAALLDIPPRAFDACRLAGVPAYAMGNFSWDSIWRDLAAERPAFGRYADKAAEAYGYTSIFFEGGMRVDLSAFPRVESVPLIARISSMEPEEARRRLDLPEEQPIALLAYGGEGVRNITLPGGEWRNRFLWTATEQLPDLGSGTRQILDRTMRERDVCYCELVAASDLVMTKPGYSTVAECAANRTPLIITPRRGFLEARVIEEYVRETLPHAVLPPDKLASGEWDEALERITELMELPYPDIPSDGAQVIARRLLEEVGSPTS